MRFGKTLLSTGLLAAALCARADLSLWVQHQPAGPLLDVLLRSMPLPGGAVTFRRPPAETRPALTSLIGASPKNADLYRLRAQEDEMQLDFTAAEADWKQYADLATDRGAGYLELADFYHRRVRPAEEIQALQTVGGLPYDKFAPAPEQRAWKAYAGMIPVIEEAGLPLASTTAAFHGWIARYPAEPAPRRQFVNLLIARKQYASAEAQITAYERAFPSDTVFPLQARVSLTETRDSADAAIRLYGKAFQPRWPKELLDAYFALLDRNEQLRDFLARARAAREKNPLDLDATGRLFAYFTHTNNPSAAHRVLIEYRLAKEAKPNTWTAAELKTLALLFDDANEQARAWYALYSVPGATRNDRETALQNLVNLLLNRPGQQIHFGSGDLSLYKDIGAMDSSPGFLNGILSLVLNSTSPRYQYEQSNAAAGAYFHRAEGARLLEFFEKEFPASPARAELRSSLVDAYASYGDDAGAIAAAQAFLTAFPRSDQRTHVALALADALARQDRTQDEFGVYTRMLTELAARASGMPLGGRATPRSPAYVQVLDQYLARLSAVNQPMEALRVYRRELDRNPNDPGLYERFAGFLEQNRLGADVQDVYRRAIAKFQQKSWYDKLARWYLRGKQQTEFAALTRQVTDIFGGTELEAYFRDAVTPDLGASMYLQLNLYAHGRFPRDLAFVHNLLNAYRTQGTANSAAAEQLLHEYWFYDPALKRLYFENLSAQGQLLNRIAAVRNLQTANPAATQWKAEAEAWLGHFEAAAPGFRSTAEQFPGSLEKNAAASSLYRSLAAYFPADTLIAASFARKAYDTQPRDTKLLETVGDIYSDKEDLTSAAAAWNRIPRVFPGKPDGFLETATVFWDYYRFPQSLRLIRDARLRYHDAALFAYEAGAIEEGRRDYALALREYLAGAAAGNEQARARIVALASRQSQRDLIYRLTASAAPALRIEVLKAQQRKPELQAFLAKEIAVATQVSAIAPLLDAARHQGLNALERAGTEREIAVTPDPVERIRLRIELATWLEAKKDVDAAARTMNALYRDNPLILGVIRARVDFEKRNKLNAEAIAALTEAAAHSTPLLSAQFRFEAARVATSAARIDEARALLTQLLNTDPYRADYLAAMADTYAAANDDAGFIPFARAQIGALNKAPLPPDDRKARIAALRRRLIATLQHRSDFPGALDQYIEIINAYPNDADITREAALFAAKQSLAPQLTSYYSKTISAAPRDWRWPVVLARLQTALENYPAALNAYDTAMKARPDRADLVQARAELEVRLLRFDDAIKSYTSLYGLTYNDAQWLDKAAELQARLGHRDQAIAALEKAHIGAGGATVSGLFAIASSLDKWHLNQDAARYAERGSALAGSDLYTRYPGEASAYAEIMASARRDDAILAIDPEQVNAIGAAGKRIAGLYTPEEKASLAAHPNIAQTLAQSAGLQDTLAKLLSSNGASQPWIALQSRRGLYEEIMARAPLPQAALAASRAGDETAQMRFYARMQAQQDIDASSLDRYLNLLLKHDPQAFIAQRSDRAVQIAIMAGNQNMALRVLQAERPLPVRLNSYTALTGIYFDDRSPQTTQAFLAALHPQTVGQRLAARPDQNRELAGSVWFYYGARFGEYLARSRASNAADFLPASLELQPGNPDAYIALARFEAETSLLPEAIADYRKALDLNPDHGEAHDGIARSLLRQGHRPEAVAAWREAIAAFRQEQSRGVRVRESFWANVGAAVSAIADAKAFTELQPDIHHLLAEYVHINGAYRISDLLLPVFRASAATSAGFDWLFDIGSAEEWSWIFLNDGNEDNDELLMPVRLAFEARRPDLSNVSTRTELVGALLSHGQTDEALAVWRRLTPREIEAQDSHLAVVRIRIAAAEGSTDALLARFRAEPAKAPALQTLLAASETLRRDGRVPAALSLLEFTYTRELEQQHLTIANFLGLARVYLERGNETGQALAALRRMTLVAGEPFEGFEPAGDLLREFHHEAEAREFYLKAVQATPWNTSATVKLGAREGLLRAAADSSAPYALRAEAARNLAPSQLPLNGELALLASGNHSEAAARKPFFVEARFTAAAASSDPATKLNLLRQALAIAPNDQRVRDAVTYAAIAAHNDSLALAVAQAVHEGYRPFAPLDRPLSIALAGAAERTGDLASAERFLVEAGGSDLKPRVAALRSEQRRRNENVARQPLIAARMEQTRIVRPSIAPSRIAPSRIAP